MQDNDRTARRKADTWTTVYNITNYKDDHPGGVIVLNEVAGTDATEAFEDVGHSEEANDMLKEYLVGTLSEEEHKEAVEVFRPTYHQVEQVAAVVVPTKKDKKTSTRWIKGARLLGVGVALGAGAIAVTGGRGGPVGVKADLALSALRKSTSLIRRQISALTGSGSSSGRLFWWGFGIASVAEMAFTAVFATWSWAKLEAQQEFTHFPARRSARPERYVPILKIPTTSGMAPSKAVSQKGVVSVMDPKQWRTFKLIRKTLVSPNVYRFVFALPTPNAVLGLPTGQHIALRATVTTAEGQQQTVTRSYTPVSNNSDLGRVELLIKVYPNGLLTNHLANMQVGDGIEMRGPKGAMQYLPSGKYAKHIGMIAGGTGITPMYQLIRAICEDETDTTTVSLIYANNKVEDILLREELDGFVRMCPEKFKVHYVLSHPPAESDVGSWTGGVGFVTADMIKEHLPAAAEDTKALLCGPPPMVNAMSKHLVDLGFKAPGALSKAGDQVFLF